MSSLNPNKLIATPVGTQNMLANFDSDPMYVGPAEQINVGVVTDVAGDHVGTVSLLTGPTPTNLVALATTIAVADGVANNDTIAYGSGEAAGESIGIYVAARYAAASGNGELNVTLSRSRVW